MYLVSSVSAERLGFKEMKLSTSLKDRRGQSTNGRLVFWVGGLGFWYPFSNNPFGKGDP